MSHRTGAQQKTRKDHSHRTRAQQRRERTTATGTTDNRPQANKDRAQPHSKKYQQKPRREGHPPAAHGRSGIHRPGVQESPYAFASVLPLHRSKFDRALIRHGHSAHNLHCQEQVVRRQPRSHLLLEFSGTTGGGKNATRRHV